MRGLVTLATAFALPQDFPDRDLVVLTAFAVVLATLIIQGVTLAPIIHLFKLGRQAEVGEEMEAARRALSDVAIDVLDRDESKEASKLRAIYATPAPDAAVDPEGTPAERRRRLFKTVIVSQRRRLREMRDADLIGPTQYLELQEDLDWQQLSVEPEEDRRLTEG